jgi:hypothetical protein
MTYNFRLADQLNKEEQNTKQERYNYLSWKVNKIGASISELMEYNKLHVEMINK